MHPDIWRFMIPEWGHFTLILALGAALIQAIAPITSRQHHLSYRLSQRSVLSQWLMITLACATLVFCFLTDDFSVRYVALNSNTLLPWYYKTVALWGAHEGSLLLWIWILATWSLAVSYAASYLPRTFHQRILSVLGLVSCAMISFTLLTSNPFLRALPDYPKQGLDLNPLLQDPGLIAHPPMLYAGYVGFSVAFAFAIAALYEGKMNAQWARWALPWTNAAFALLTCGIVLGSWWSYRQLGWGGWWYWDPVENASFMPWLLGCALIHSLHAVSQKNRLISWCALLAIATFALSLLGTFLVRSGILVSVHSFATDPSRGRYLIVLLLSVIGSSLILYAQQYKKMTPPQTVKTHRKQSLRLYAIIGNNLILTIVCLSVLLATLYPSLLAILFQETISIGPPYYQQVLLPFWILLLLLMSALPTMSWNKTRPHNTTPLLIWQGTSLSIGLIAFYYFPSLGLTILGYALGMSLIFACGFMLAKNKGLQQIPMLLAHCGLGIAVLAITTNLTFSTQKTLRMHLGSQTHFQNYTLQLTALTEQKHANYLALDARFTVQPDNHRPGSILHPQLRHYLAPNTTQAKVAILTEPFADLYLTLAQPINQQEWVVSVYYKPGIRWIWYGFLLIALASFSASWLHYLNCKRIKALTYAKKT
jgi:cytochrome c-type biogenesis protein CcmF